MRNIISLLFLLLVGLACNQRSPITRFAGVTVNAGDSIPKKNLKNLVLDSKKDLSCGMPIGAGIADTAHYKGKLYGFCSPECKAAFIKNPSAYLSGK